MAVIANVSLSRCRDINGTPVNCRNVIGSCGLSYCPPGSMKQICDCYVPDPVPAAVAPTPTPAQITVSPAITVSPQISPNFQQQFQPSNSPATAGTQQGSTAPSPVYQPQPTAAPVYQPQPTAAPVYQPQPMAAPVAYPAQVAPPPSAPVVQPAPMPAYSSGVIGTGPAFALPPELSDAAQHAVGQPNVAPASQPEKKRVNPLLFIGLGVLGIMLLSTRKVNHATR